MIKVRITSSVRVKGPIFTDKVAMQMGVNWLADWKRRVQSGVGVSDQPMLPLGKGYAKYKRSVVKRRPIRDMTLTGEFMRNFTLRKATVKSTVASATTRRNRQKAFHNERKQRFMGFSPRNAYNIYKQALGHLTARLPNCVVKTK